MRLPVPRASLLVLILPLAAGCAAVPQSAGFDDVRKEVADRTGRAVQWRGRTAEDAAVDAAVRDLLSHELTVADAVQVALLNNRHLQATYEDLGVAQADVVQAGLLKNPVFDVGVRIPDRRPKKTYLNFGVTEDFLDVLFIPARKKVAQAAFANTKAAVANEVLSIAAQTATAFYQYQAATQRAELMRSVADAQAASLDAAKRLHDAGNTDDLTYLNEKAQDTRARIDLATAQADAADARERLNELMGLADDQTNWKAAPRLPDLPAADLRTEGLESLALRQRLDVESARQDVLAQSRVLGITDASRWFSSAAVGADAERETDGQWRIGPSASLPIPLFDQGQASVSRARSLLRQSRFRYQAMETDVRSEVRAAVNRLNAAGDKARTYRDAVLPVQRQVLAQTQLQYNGMYVSVFQLLQAKRDEIDAGRGYVDALRDYWVARAELERAVGGRLPEVADERVPSTAPAAALQ